MNENNNRVQRAISAAEFATITGLMNELERLLIPYTVGLTPEERISIPKVNVDNKVFIQDAINEMKLPSSANILPAFFKPMDAESDLLMFEQCEGLTSRLNSLASKVDSTRMLAGSEAFNSVLTFKKLADAAEAAGVPGADQTARKLRERFKGQGTPGKTDPPKPEENKPE
jgi:hypothetical protein